MSATTRAQSARALRTLAARVEQGSPIEATPGHLRDAARAVERGNHDGARRHLIAAMHTFEPRMLYRHGIMNDSGHARARADLGQVHRQYLRVRDVQDEEARADDRRQAAAARRAASDGGNTAAGRPPPPAGLPPPTLNGDGPQLSTVLDMVFNPKELRDPHGKWMFGGSSGLRAPGPPGSFEHARWMDRVAETMSNAETRNAVHEATRAMIGRDLKTAHQHMANAIELDQLLGHGTHVGDLRLVDASLNKVPKTAAIRNRPRNPLSREAQHPGRYVESHLVSEPRTSMKYRAPNIRAAAGYANGQQAIELFNPMEARGAHGMWTREGKEAGHAGTLDTDQVEKSYGKGPADHLRTAAFAERHGDHELVVQHVDTAYRQIAATMQRNREGRGSPGNALLNNLHLIRQRHAGAMLASPTTAEQMEIAAIGLAMSDDEVAVLLRDEWMDFSAQTEALASTHRPFGKPGGPGLWNVKGMQLPAYIQNIARALLRTGRARNLSHAIAIARAATKRWAKGGGNVHPEVRAASAATGAEWEASRARAHTHSNDGGTEILLFNPYHAPPGTGGGQFTTAGGAGKGAAKTAPGAKAAVSGMQRQVLVAQIKVIRTQIAALKASLVTGNAPPAGTMASRTAKAGKAGTAAAARKAAAPSKAQAAKSKSSTPRKHGVTKMSARTRAQVKARIVQLQAQLRSDLAKLHGH